VNNRPFSRLEPSFLKRGALLLALLAPLAPFAPKAAMAQGGMPADAVFQGFKPTGEYIFSLGGADIKDAEIYLSEKAGAYLIIAPALASPILLNARTQNVESVSFMKVQKNADRSVDLLADASFEQLDKFKVASGQKVTFNLKGKEGALRPRPPLLGLQTSESFKTNKPDYGFRAEEYKPDPALVAKLKAETRNVRVRVYFGTWCPVCGRMVPKILKLASELQGSKIQFEYYGLPQPMSDDPITGKENLNGVPTAIVYVDGKEFGREDGHTLNQPEQAFLNTLAGIKH
jgi:thiol-disulfide isomerase/thioredoxin